jgi:hypothetical protein
VVKLLNNYRQQLIDLTQNFTKIPTKRKDMIAFYKIFKAGNPLIDPNVKTTPGIVDLCYCGINLPDEDYTVFRRNKMRYIDIKRQVRENKKKTVLLKKNFKVDKKKIKEKKKAKALKAKMEKAKAKEGLGKIGKWATTLKQLKGLSVQPEIGVFDIWATN